MLSPSPVFKYLIGTPEIKESFNKVKHKFFSEQKTNEWVLPTAEGAGQSYAWLIENRVSLKLEYDQHTAACKRKGSLTPADEAYTEYLSVLLYYSDRHDVKHRDLHHAMYAKKTDPNSSRLLPELIDLDGKLNLFRLCLRFCEIFCISASAAYHLPFNPQVAQRSIAVFNPLSVFFFASRFILNAYKQLDRSFNATDFEKESTTKWARFCDGFFRDHAKMINDAMWTVGNMLTNYAALCHVAAPLATPLLASFLTFDVVWIGYQLYRAELDCERKRVEYEAYKLTLDANDTEGHAREDLKIKELEYQLVALQSEWLFYLAAALLLVVGGAAAFMFAPALYVPLCVLVCNIAIAMYFSGGQFGEYKKQKTIGDEVEIHKASNALFFSMLEYTFVPIVIMEVFIVFWPAAVALAVSYVLLRSMDWSKSDPVKGALDEGKVLSLEIRQNSFNGEEMPLLTPEEVEKEGGLVI